MLSFCVSSCSHSSCLQIATLIAVYANWAFAAIKGIGWGWAGVIWLYNIVTYIPLDVIKFLIRYALSGRAWNLVLEQRVRTHIKRMIVDFHCSVFGQSNACSSVLVVACQMCNHLFLLAYTFRLRSQARRTSARKKGSASGRMLRGLCMGSSRQRHPSSRTRRPSTN